MNCGAFGYLAAGENIPPFAIASVSPTGGPINTVYTFSALNSADPDNNLPVSYRWDFGDGSTLTTSAYTVTHTYTSTGVKTVNLVVTDSGTPPVASEPATLRVYPGNNPAHRHDRVDQHHTAGPGELLHARHLGVRGRQRQRRHDLARQCLYVGGRLPPSNALLLLFVPYLADTAGSL